MKILLKNFLNFFKWKKFPTYKYKHFVISDDFGVGFEELLEKNKKLLFDNGISLDKIRFIYTPAFIYEIDKNKINPTFQIYLPFSDDGIEQFMKGAPILEVDKPENVVNAVVNEYTVDDNYAFIEELVKKTKRGIVIYIKENNDTKDLLGNTFRYEFGVHTNVLKLKDLDEIEVEETVEYVIKS